MTIAKLPHTQRLHFSHISVCGLLLEASLKWRDYNLQTKQRRLQIQIQCEWKFYDVCIHWMQPRLSSHVMTMLTITECHTRGFIVTMSHVTRTVILPAFFCNPLLHGYSLFLDSGLWWRFCDLLIGCDHTRQRILWISANNSRFQILDLILIGAWTHPVLIGFKPLYPALIQLELLRPLPTLLSLKISFDYVSIC